MSAADNFNEQFDTFIRCILRSTIRLFRFGCSKYEQFPLMPGIRAEKM